MFLRMAVPLGFAILSCCASAATRGDANRAPGRARAAAPDNVDHFEARILAAHNRYRADAGVPALQWDARLAAGARQFGSQLAAAGHLVHSPRQTRVGQGENLWMGSAGAYRLEDMVQNWAQERALFRAGVFPDVSATRNWGDVGHYTQLIWPRTTHIGCALMRGQRWDYLICRYAPAGNRDGERIP